MRDSGSRRVGASEPAAPAAPSAAESAGRSVEAMPTRRRRRAGDVAAATVDMQTPVTAPGAAAADLGAAGNANAGQRRREALPPLPLNQLLGVSSSSGNGRSAHAAEATGSTPTTAGAQGGSGLSGLGLMLSPTLLMAVSAAQEVEAAAAASGGGNASGNTAASRASSSPAAASAAAHPTTTAIPPPPTVNWSGSGGGRSDHGNATMRMPMRSQVAAPPAPDSAADSTSPGAALWMDEAGLDAVGGGSLAYSHMPGSATYYLGDGLSTPGLTNWSPLKAPAAQVLPSPYRSFLPQTPHVGGSSGGGAPGAARIPPPTPSAHPPDPQHLSALYGAGEAYPDASISGADPIDSHPLYVSLSTSERRLASALHRARRREKMERERALRREAQIRQQRMGDDGPLEDGGDGGGAGGEHSAATGVSTEGVHSVSAGGGAAGTSSTGRKPVPPEVRERRAQRNRESARRSRLAFKRRMEQLERDNAGLQQTVREYRAEIERLQAEVQRLHQLEAGSGHGMSMAPTAAGK
ncbi:hypothetical protein CDCA_CDCA15G3948 [Cyanidium caldarium]|uniref:BZIP domain-containing protein n=1 Tax=Cyanidium caldarium TaxID=2771 RepID=A0AAV9J0Q9_CYACA|nr:hypothetical protein CDCA_CDCA15G3948 [Cyanidium caldarium]